MVRNLADIVSAMGGLSAADLVTESTRPSLVNFVRRVTRSGDEVFLLLAKDNQAAIRESEECSIQRTGEVVARAEILVDEANSTSSSNVRAGYVWRTPQHVTCFGGGITATILWKPLHQAPRHVISSLFEPKFPPGRTGSSY
jgi:hypothetical protein